MHDYNSDYRRLKAAGLPGWAGDQHARNSARLAETLQRFEDHFPAPPASVLELGCGNGMSWSHAMARKGYDVHGIDISETAIDWAEQGFAQSGLSGAFRQGSVCAMPFFADEAFDIVIDGACLHCLIGNDRTRCLREVSRILRPDGVFVVSSMCGLPKSDEARASFDPRTGHLLRDGRPYRTLKPLDDLARELTEAGFEVRDTRLSINPWWDHVTMVCFPPPQAGEGEATSEERALSIPPNANGRRSAGRRNQIAVRRIRPQR
jgi:2-polyprenyl-3-methyl-5-hydroxy-6-metoxy-1,4-benzoquinol methylase